MLAGSRLWAGGCSAALRQGLWLCPPVPLPHVSPKMGVTPVAELSSLPKSMEMAKRGLVLPRGYGLQAASLDSVAWAAKPDRAKSVRPEDV